MAIKLHIKNPLLKKAKKGFQGYPVATVAYYGSDNKTATKVAVGIIRDQAAEAEYLERWFLEQGDVRTNSSINDQILQFIKKHSARSVVITDGIIDCPHEEGKDYPDGEVCLKCPYWTHRDRWTGETLN